MGESKAKEKLDILLHPVRMRILMAVAGNQLSSRDILEQLPEVSQATLYRHIRRLAKAGILSVAEERPVRGITEKVYTLVSEAANLSPHDLEKFSREDHMRYFITFIASLLDEFSRYLQKDGPVDLAADGVAYRKMPLNLSDEEFGELNRQSGQIVLPYLNNPPGEGRTRRIVSTVVIPETRG